MTAGSSAECDVGVLDGKVEVAKEYDTPDFKTVNGLVELEEGWIHVTPRGCRSPRPTP